MIAWDFNMKPNDKDIQYFLDNLELYNLIKGKTCFKSAQGSCIDLMLTNKKHSFMHSQTIQTGISDFHKMTLTQMKLTYNKLPPKTITYRDFKSFNKDALEEELKFALQAANIQPTYANFLIFSRTLDNHASPD